MELFWISRLAGGCIESSGGQHLDGGAELMEMSSWRWEQRIKPSACAGPLSRVARSNPGVIRGYFDGYNLCGQTKTDQQGRRP